MGLNKYGKRGLEEHAMQVRMSWLRKELSQPQVKLVRHIVLVLSSMAFIYFSLKLNKIRARRLNYIG